MSPGRLRIAQVVTSDLSLRVLLLDQLKALQQAGHEVTGICAPGPFVNSVRQEGVTVETIPMKREIAPVQDLRSLRALYRLFCDRHFDVVHTHTPKAGLLGPLAARLAGVPVVVHTVHGFLFHDRMPRWRQCLFWMPEKFTSTCAHRLLSQSGEDVAVATEKHICTAGRISYLGNGINVTCFSPALHAGLRVAARQEIGVADDEVVVGAVGRLVYEKGFAELFAAAERLIPRLPKVRFLIVGPRETDQKDAIAPEQIERLSRSGRVTFLNWREDMARWYAAMDIFVLPSHREGVPRACMEAAAMALPVIATDIRGCREVVRDGESGLLVPVRSSEALASAIETLAHDPQRRHAMGGYGRKHIEANFDQRMVIERLTRYYSGIASALDKGAAHA